ncbi:MAG: hypothetical protein N2747_08145 [Chitinophagaceae bacterium]|nr:hypothetical protein [Chitinophagaceae bacterium]
MPVYLKYFLSVVIVLFAGILQGKSQTAELSDKSADDLLFLSEIKIEGNQKTKQDIILRELPFSEHQSIPASALTELVSLARCQLMNTTLFHHVDVIPQITADQILRIQINVKERWYLFPFPYFKPVDRNLNQWLLEHQGDLRRVNYGIRFQYNNATGRNDKLRIWIINGYAPQITLHYDRMFLDKKMKWGAMAGFSIGKTKEINYATENNKQAFLKDPSQFLRKFVNAQFLLSYRPAINTRHLLGFTYTQENISDTVLSLNPEYFKTNRLNTRFPTFLYQLNWFNLDYIPYPTKGYALQLTVSKSGLDRTVNLWQTQIRALGNWHLSPKTFFHVNLYGGIKLPFRQPFFNRRFLGYGDIFMQGYEYYVVDGVAGGYGRATLSRELLRFRTPMPKIKNKKMTDVPFRIFGKVYGNTGYVYDPQPGTNTLSNRWLYSGGIGVDIFTLYDIIVKLEWSFNRFGQNSLFLHRKTFFN